MSVRIHLEENSAENGPLEVIPGSQNMKGVGDSRVTYFVPKGGVHVLHPLVLHASSKMKLGRRRVLHFLFGPASLPDGAEWAFSK